MRDGLPKAPPLMGNYWQLRAVEQGRVTPLRTWLLVGCPYPVDVPAPCATLMELRGLLASKEKEVMKFSGRWVELGTPGGIAGR